MVTKKKEPKQKKCLECGNSFLGLERKRFCNRRCIMKNFHRKYYQEHREYFIAYGKKYYQEHRKERIAYYKKYNKENREHINLIIKNWKRKNYRTGEKAKRYKEKACSYAKKYRKLYPERALKGVKKWRIKNHEYLIEYNRRKRAKKLNAPGNHTLKQIEFLRNISGGFCPGYNKPSHHVGNEKLTTDHIIPLSKGGSDYIENIQMMCKSCNSSKGGD